MKDCSTSVRSPKVSKPLVELLRNRSREGKGDRPSLVDSADSCTLYSGFLQKVTGFSHKGEGNASLHSWRFVVVEANKPLRGMEKVNEALKHRGLRSTV